MALFCRRSTADTRPNAQYADTLNFEDWVKHPVDTFGYRFAMNAIAYGPPVSIIRSPRLWQDMRAHSAALW